MIGGALFPQVLNGAPHAVTRLYRGTELARLEPMWRERASVLEEYKKQPEKNAQRVR